MITNGVTAGEKLCRHIYERYVASAPWLRIERELHFTARGQELTEYFKQLTAIQLTGKTVRAGVSLTREADLSDARFQHAFREFIRELFLVADRRLDDLFRLSSAAVQSALDSISPGLARTLRKFAQECHPDCYICGVPLFFSDPTNEDESRRRHTADHIWPRAYGGDSTIENLLPACAKCNNSNKGDLATWASLGVQSIILGLDPNPEALASISGEYRFGLHYRAAQDLAQSQRLSLKEAYLRLRPWTSRVRVIDESDVADFFNLANHREG